MADLIQATVVGRLTRDAELRQAGDTPVCSFRVAATPYKQQALFFSVSVWGRRGETIAQYLTKGTQVTVVGSLSQCEYESNGETRTSLEIRASEIVFSSQGERAASDEGESGDDDAGLPF